MGNADSEGREDVARDRCPWIIANMPLASMSVETPERVVLPCFSAASMLTGREPLGTLELDMRSGSCVRYMNTLDQHDVPDIKFCSREMNPRTCDCLYFVAQPN